VQYEIHVEGRARQLQIVRAGNRFQVSLDGRESTVDAARVDPQTLSLLVGSVSYEVRLTPDPLTRQIGVSVDGVPLTVSLNGRRRWGRKDDAAGSGPQRIAAPMPGRILRLAAAPGDRVEPRQPLVVIEAMKMENELRASRAGIVAELHVQEGQLVDAGALLLVVVPA
jgi:acetyl/propionyl-CoA carboxylase alpha subunit